MGGAVPVTIYLGAADAFADQTVQSSVPEAGSHSTNDLHFPK